MFLLHFPIIVPAVTETVAFSETKADCFQPALLIWGPIHQHRYFPPDTSMRLQCLHPLFHSLLGRDTWKYQPGQSELDEFRDPARDHAWLWWRQSSLALQGRTGACGEEWSWERLTLPVWDDTDVLPDDKHNLWRLILEFMAWCQFYVADILDFIGQAPSSGYFYYHFLFCLTQSLML